MSRRRILAFCTIALLAGGVFPKGAEAQFTPRFSTREQGPPREWHVGLSLTSVNLGDYTSEQWPELKAPVPVFAVRGGWALPVKGETWFLMPEIEFHLASTSGTYAPPSQFAGTSPGATYDVSGIVQTGFSVTANLLRASDDRRTMLGGGLGYYLINHDPKTTSSMSSAGASYFRDPFTHLGMGLQVHAARSIREFNAKSRLMVEGRYRIALLGGNTSDRTLLMSDFLLSLYIAVK